MEEINCLNCIHITDDFDCDRKCGNKKGWNHYEVICENIEYKGE